jgi:hypothetical protein
MAEPTLADVIRDGLEGRLEDVFTSTIGRIEKYDPDKQVADIRPVIRRPYNAGGYVEHEELPVLPNVPVMFPRGGGYFMKWPIKKGDHVLLVFTHDSIQMWREKGDITDPVDLTRHGLGSCIAIAGVAPADDPIEDDGDAEEGVMGGGIWRVGKAAAVPVALAPIVDSFIAAVKEFCGPNGHKHGTGTGPSTPPIAPLVWEGGAPYPGEGSTKAKKLKAE